MNAAVMSVLSPLGKRMSRATGTSVLQRVPDGPVYLHCARTRQRAMSYQFVAALGRRWEPGRRCYVA